LSGIDERGDGRREGDVIGGAEEEERCGDLCGCREGEEEPAEVRGALTDGDEAFPGLLAREAGGNGGIDPTPPGRAIGLCFPETGEGKREETERQDEDEQAGMAGDGVECEQRGEGGRSVSSPLPWQNGLAAEIEESQGARGEKKRVSETAEREAGAIGGRIGVRVVARREPAPGEAPREGGRGWSEREGME
jgi:hypothetical protein